MIKEYPVIKNTLIALATILGIFVFFRYIFRLLLPFLIAFFIAFLLKTPIDVISRRMKIGKRAVAAVFVSVTVLFAGFVLFLVGSSLLNELQRFSSVFSKNSENYVSRFMGFIDSVSTKFPFSFFQKDINWGLQLSLSSECIAEKVFFLCLYRFFRRCLS